MTDEELQQITGIAPKGKSTNLAKTPDDIFREYGIVAPDTRGKFEQFATGMGKGALSTLRGAGELGTKILDFATGGAPQEGSALAKASNIYRSETVEGAKAKEALKPTTGAEKFGFGVEQVGEFFIPASKIAQVEKVLAEGSKGTALVSRLTSLVGKKAAEAIATTGTKATVRAIEGGGIVALQSGGDAKQVKEAGLISAAFPVVGAGASALKEAIKTPEAGARIINSLIKPLLKDFSYGKNPGRAIAEEGITASNLDDLAQKIGQRRQEIGSEIGEIVSEVSKQGKTINMANVIKPLDDAIARANKSPRTNKGLIDRLEDAKADLLQGRNLENMTPEEAFAFKQVISDITKFTGNASDDAVINKSLKAIYGNVKDEINKSAEGIKSKSGKSIEELNEKYADLSSAEIATKYRDKIEARQNIISLPQNIIGIGGAITTAIASGGAAIPTLIVGAGGVALQKAMSSPKIKTRVAKWLASATPEEKKRLFDASPALKGAIIKTFIGED